MNIEEFKNSLSKLDQVEFVLPNNEHVPAHFHITEMGIITKDYIDCGGTIRKERSANFQIWHANDYEHRINPQKIIDIINTAEKSILLENLEVEVEYQSDTIGKYGLSFQNNLFLLTPTYTDCLAKEKCGIPDNNETEPKPETCCSPSTGCC
jgi:hypothetical protein